MHLPACAIRGAWVSAGHPMDPLLCSSQPPSLQVPSHTPTAAPSSLLPPLSALPRASDSESSLFLPQPSTAASSGLEPCTGRQRLPRQAPRSWLFSWREAGAFRPRRPCWAVWKKRTDGNGTARQGGEQSPGSAGIHPLWRMWVRSGPATCPRSHSSWGRARTSTQMCLPRRLRSSAVLGSPGRVGGGGAPGRVGRPISAASQRPGPLDTPRRSFRPWAGRVPGWQNLVGGGLFAALMLTLCGPLRERLSHH